MRLRGAGDSRRPAFRDDFLTVFSGAFVISSGSKIPASAPASPDVTALSFEAALHELETIVARLERGDVDLEDSISLYERGQRLKTHCDGKLKAAEGRLEKIVQGASGPAVMAAEA